MTEAKVKKSAFRVTRTDARDYSITMSGFAADSKEAVELFDYFVEAQAALPPGLCTAWTVARPLDCNVVEITCDEVWPGSAGSRIEMADGSSMELTSRAWLAAVQGK